MFLLKCLRPATTVFNEGRTKGDRFHKYSAMESVNGGASSKGVLVPVSELSDVFQTSILASLKSAYLYEESKLSFKYKSAVLVKNPALEEKYHAFRAKGRELGYSEQDLEESFGFLLFDDVSKANSLGETGVLTGNSTCTTLGDPSNGVYISMYSDCLDLNRWYHGKSGYIAIIKLTKGRVKRVLENYTQNFTKPTVGFDCHVSEQLHSVSAKTSSFLAFERTQYYMYELLDDGSNATTPSPSAACPFAVVSFSYTDTKVTLDEPQEKSKEKKLVCHYFPWRGQLQIDSKLYEIGLRSTAGALIPAKLPPELKVDRAISMFDLRQFLPSTIFETCFSGEVFTDGLYFSLCLFVSSEQEETHSFSQLVAEIKEKDLALTIQLKDGGFLVMLHSSHFLTYDDTTSSATDVLQGLFVFPVSRVVQRDTKCGQKKVAISSEILQVLPVLSYAEGEVEKTPIDPGEELCEVFAHHMQSYAALINPGLASPSREVSMFPDQYDVPDAHKHLYSSPEWTDRAWESFRTYLNKPLSFQLPLSKASEILASGQEDRIEDLEDDVYICLSSPEEAPSNPSMESEEQLMGQKSPIHSHTPVDSCISSAEAQLDLKAVPQNVVPDDLPDGVAVKDIGESDLSVLIKTDDMAKSLLTPSTPDDLPGAELIVSITSAERTVTDESLTIISTVSATKSNDLQLSDFPTAKLQMAGMNSLNDETLTAKKILDLPDVTNLTKRTKESWRHSHSQKNVSETYVEASTWETPVEGDRNKSLKEDNAKVSSGLSQSSNPSNVEQTKLQRQKLKSPKKRKGRSVGAGLAAPKEKKTDDVGKHSLESSVLTNLEPCPLRKKTERWDIKPVISECGRILVPHGSVDFADQIKSLKDKIQSTKCGQSPKKTLADTSVNAHDTVDMQLDCSPAPETAATPKDGRNPLQNVVMDLNSLHSVALKNAHLSLDSKTHNTEAVTEKDSVIISAEKRASKADCLLSKLKSVLLRGKRKTDHVSQETPVGTVQDTEPCLKRGILDSDAGLQKSNYAITSVQDTSVHVQEVSKMLSVDPIFAYALGLTPKQTPVQETEGQKTDSSDTQENQTILSILDRQTQIMQRPTPIFNRRIKTLKKHQGISAEYVKKKWWLHFQSPASLASEKLKNKECTRDKSVRKTVKGRANSTCSPIDALNLLADLALSVNSDQVPPQPGPARERKPEKSMKKSDLIKDVNSAERKSVPRALLRQPAATTMKPLKSPSPNHLVGSGELVGLVSKEHAYSLPPSSSLLLGLPGTPFQVPPLSGSTRLLQRHQTMHANGIKTLHPSVGQEERSEQEHRTPDGLKKYMGCRRKFRHTRTFVNKDESVQVTKQWKESYDFNLDSKFTSDPKDRTIVRALHGPWDFSMQDTSEEVQLIVHMWIGLFYSRSTARFFHVDQCSEDIQSPEMSSGTASAPAQSELKADSSAPVPSVMDCVDTSDSIALDLSKKDASVLDQGSAVLDLSLRNSGAEIVTSNPQVNNNKETSMVRKRKKASETLNTLKSPKRPPEPITNQTKIIHYQPPHPELPAAFLPGLALRGQPIFLIPLQMLQTKQIVQEVNGVRSANENMRTCIPLQKPVSLEHPVVKSCKGDAQEEKKNISVLPENNQTASGIGQASHEWNTEKVMKGGIENSNAIEKILKQYHRKKSSKYVPDEEVKLDKEAGVVVHTAKNDNIKSKVGETRQVNDKSSQEGDVEPSPKVLNTKDDSTNEDSGRVCNENVVENEKRLSTQESSSVSLEKAENVACTVQEEKVMEVEVKFGKEDGVAEKDSCISHMEGDTSLSNQPLPVIYNGPDLVKDCSMESSPKPPLDENISKADVCHNLQLQKTDEHASLEKHPHAPTEMETIGNEPTLQRSSENLMSLEEKALTQKALPMSDEKNCSLDGSITQTNDGVETESQKKITANLNLNCGVNEDQDANSTARELKEDKTTDDKTHQESHSPHCKVDETDLTQINKTKEGLEGNLGEVVVASLEEAPVEETEQPHESPSQCKVQEGHEEIPFLSATTSSESVLPMGVFSTSLHQNAAPSAGKISPSIDESGSNLISNSEWDERCPTPTMDEEPYGFVSDLGSANASAISKSETSKNTTHKGLSSTSIACKFSDSSDANHRHGLQPDVKLRTSIVLQRIDELLTKPSHSVTINHTETANMKHTLDQKLDTTSQHIATSSAPNSSTFHITDKSNMSLAVVSASTSKELTKDSTEHPIISSIKLEEILQLVKLQTEKANSSVPHYCDTTDKLQEMPPEHDCHPHRTVPSIESLQDVESNIDQERPKTTSQTNLSHSQRPVMAVKPSKSDDGLADDVSQDRQMENTAASHCPENNQTKTLVVTSITPTATLVEEKVESPKRTSERPSDEKLEDIALPSKSIWLPSIRDNKSQNVSTFNKTPLSLNMQSCESAENDSKLDEIQDIVHSLVGKVGQTTEESLEVDQKNDSNASTSHADQKVGTLADDGFFQQNSLMCTVYNTSRKRPYSFLEQVSHRCIQDDPTEASMEQECLIFSEQMKLLLKRSRRSHVSQQETPDQPNKSSSTPVTVHFSSLEEQEDSADHVDANTVALSLDGQKFKVDMSDRKDLADSAEKAKTLHPQKCSQGTGNPMTHAGVHSVTSECARLYEAMMADVYAAKKVPSTLKRIRVAQGYPTTEPNNHFDFCDQLKKEADESFQSSLKSVVKKSCKTKFRFYILVTSDEAFFGETKAQLEAEGHVAVEPSQFFHAEDSPSSLLIILRNEDIAEHICKVPHLLELKKSSAVQFAGIDEPDDVLNLTHQELFTRGGFIVLDSAVLEPLSLCNMKKLSEVLQGLSRMGKWKWMLHYRDSRRLKENARLSAEAKEKKHFLNLCQESEILEVLPYHECDLISRDLPDYLRCLVRLQVQNISARYTVFITANDNSLEQNGILTMTLDSFLMCSSNKTFTA